MRKNEDYREEMKTMLLAVGLTAAAMLLLSVRVLFGRKKEFLRGHACRGVPRREDRRKGSAKR